MEIKSFSKKRCNIFPKEESTGCLTTHHLEDEFFLYHPEHQIGKIHPLLHSIFKELSNNNSHAQIRVKMKKLWRQQVGEEKQAIEQKLCRDKVHFVATKS